MNHGKMKNLAWAAFMMSYRLNSSSNSGESREKMTICSPHTYRIYFIEAHKTRKENYNQSDQNRNVRATS